MNDIEIARAAKLKPVNEIASKLCINEEYIENYGKYKAKITLEPESSPKGKLILVTAINPTPFGEGKTTVSIGLADGLSKIGKKVALALREPSLGPVFGIKGGAAGGGYSQVVPMEDINLHFTGDFHAITSANNLLSSLIDNHIKQGNELNLDINRISWKRCLDLNDRALRVIECGLGGEINGTPRTDGFQITAASEIMAIMCLSKDLSDLKDRLSNIVIGHNKEGGIVKAKDLQAQDSMAILLKDALYPNLVQTLEGTPAIIHLGPFANIAHGCNSIRATKLSLSLSDYTVTEAGFGADLGAEKFLDIKCRIAGLTPDAVVLTATVRGLKYNGGFTKESKGDGISELKSGLKNLEGHLDNLTKKFKVKTVVAINKFITDTEEEINIIKECAKNLNVECYETRCFALGGAGSTELAAAVVRLCNEETKPFNYTYSLEDSIENKITAVAVNVYGAAKVIFSDKAKEKLADIKELGYGGLPVCIAKTQYSFSQDAKLLGRPVNFDFFVKDIELRAGSGFVIAIAGDILLMPGLSKTPAAINMTIDEKGKITGLF